MYNRTDMLGLIIRRIHMSHISPYEVYISLVYVLLKCYEKKKSTRAL